MKDEDCIKLVDRELEELRKNSRFDQMKESIQHGCTTVYEHCISVAYTSCLIAKKTNANVDYKSLIRGALLHDYFLYDWHNNTGEGLHGFTHPKKALKNAKEDFVINKIEEDIIVKHMFPLTLKIPKYKESWIVTTADKIVSLRETFTRTKNGETIKN